MSHAQVRGTLMLSFIPNPTSLPTQQVTYHSACLSLVVHSSHQSSLPFAIRITPLKHPKNTKQGLIRSRALPLTSAPKVFSRFVQHGKATLMVTQHLPGIGGKARPESQKQPASSHQLSLSDCDPRALRIFLVTLRVKMRVAECLRQANHNRTLRALIGTTQSVNKLHDGRSFLVEDKNDLRGEGKTGPAENVSLLEEVSLVGDRDHLVLYAENLHQHFSSVPGKVVSKAGPPPSPILRKGSVKSISLTGQLFASPHTPSRRNSRHLRPLTSTPQRNGLQRLLFPEALAASQQLPLPLEVIGPVVAVRSVASNPRGVVLREPLNSEQEEVLQTVLQGHNVFITGGAGTGKSFLIRHILARLPGVPQTVVTASTGVAAYHIGGRTLHSFAGLSRALQVAKEQAQPLSATSAAFQDLLHANPEWRREWISCRHLLLDEVSMVDADTFLCLDMWARAARGVPNKPFGGVQLILAGDFLQLPPVRTTKDQRISFAFQSSSWRTANIRSCLLSSVQRQSDPQLIELLQQVRHGKCPANVLRILQDTASQCRTPPPGVPVTVLCTHRHLVHKENVRLLNALQGPGVTFVAEDLVATTLSTASRAAPAVPGNTQACEELSEKCPAAASLTLKVGAHVMLLKNLDVKRGLVNGTRGVVTEFQQQPGQSNLNPPLPMVTFQIAADAAPVSLVVQREVWRVRTNNTSCLTPELQVFRANSGRQDEIWLERRQLPLTLAWAYSVHKSQGMTLDFAEIYLDSTFECGQAYVALSRCRSLATMRVMRISPQSISADATVLAFYRALEEAKEMKENGANKKLTSK